MSFASDPDWAVCFNVALICVYMPVLSSVFLNLQHTSMHQWEVFTNQLFWGKKKKVLICSNCWLPWCKYCCQGWSKLPTWHYWLWIWREISPGCLRELASAVHLTYQPGSRRHLLSEGLCPVGTAVNHKHKHVNQSSSSRALLLASVSVVLLAGWQFSLTHRVLTLPVCGERGGFCVGSPHCQCCQPAPPCFSWVRAFVFAFHGRSKV